MNAVNISYEKIANILKDSILCLSDETYTCNKCKYMHMWMNGKIDSNQFDGICNKCHC